jgi:hypothetical protein
MFYRRLAWIFWADCRRKMGKFIKFAWNMKNFKSPVTNFVAFPHKNAKFVWIKSE